jgi:MFS family permease
MPVAALYMAVTAYWGFGMATGPAWNTWAGTLVPRSVRARYFARRARWGQLSLVLGLAAGGAILQAGGRFSEPLHAYAFLFGVALLARVVSSRFLIEQSEPRPIPLGETRIAPGAIRDYVSSGGHGRLLAFLLVFQSGVWIAAPYFTPFMLGPLGLDYVEFAFLTGSAFLARVLALPAIGRIAHRSGTRRVLWLASIGIVPLPMLWLVSDSFAWLLGLQVVGGVAWAGFELATLLSFFEHIPERTRTTILSIYNLAHASAVTLGTAVGALILRAGDGAEAFGLLLVVSTLARLASLGLMRGQADVVPSSVRAPVLRTLGLRPSAGALQRPVLSAMDLDEDEEGP